jgi:hypothetical protein
VRLNVFNKNDVPCTLSGYRMRIRIGQSERSLWGREIAATLEHSSIYGNDRTGVNEKGIKTTYLFPPRVTREYPLARGCESEGWVLFEVMDYALPTNPDGSPPEMWVSDEFTVGVIDPLRGADRPHESVIQKMPILPARVVD